MAQSGALKLVALNHIYSIDIWSCAMIPTKYKTPDDVWWFLGHLFSTIAIGFSAMPADRWTCSRQRIGKRTVKTQVHENQIDYIQLYTISSNFSIVMQLDLAIPSNSVQFFHPIPFLLSRSQLPWHPPTTVAAVTAVLISTAEWPSQLRVVRLINRA